MEDRHKMFALVILVILFGYLSYRILAPFLTYIILGLIFAFLCYPIYKRVSKGKNDTGVAILLLVCVLLLIILPSIWIGTTLVTQGTDAYRRFQESGVTLAGLASHYGVNAEDLQNSLNVGKSSVAAAIPRVITTTGEFLVGLVVFFLVMYYALKDGKEWYIAASNAIPIRKTYKKRLQDEIEVNTKALFFGQILTAVLIGLFCGIVFWLFGIPNPVFWGFLMIILAFLPLLGAPVVYVPAGIILMYRGEWISGISVIVLCTAAIFAVEYIIRPKFVSRSAPIHPLTVIIGALGGIYLMGFVGFLIGPLILSLFLTLLSFEYGE